MHQLSLFYTYSKACCAITAKAKARSRKLPSPKVDDVDSHGHSPDSIRLATRPLLKRTKHDVRGRGKETFNSS